MGKPTSNPGPVSVEVLAGLIGTDVLPADQVIPLTVFPVTAVRTAAPFIALPPGFRPLFTGTNYATGGARNHDTNTPGIGLFPNAVPTETQIANYLNRHQPDDHALYVVSSGGNDVSYAMNFASDPSSYVTGAANSLAAAIATLQRRGAQYIIVAGLPESFGTASQQTLRQLYDTELATQLTALGVSYAWADVNGLRTQIVANPSSFGIAHVTNALADRACTTPSEGLGITSGWAYLCSPISPVSQPISATFAEQALFSDDEHWATGGHTILGRYYFCLAVRTWPQLFPPQLKRPLPYFGTLVPAACVLARPTTVNAQ